MSPIHLPVLIAIHLSPSLAGGVRFSGCLQFICLPVWLVVSGSPDVSNSFVFPYGTSFVSQSGWWCPAPRMFPIHLSPLIAFLPVWLVVSGSPDVSNSFVFPYGTSFVSQSGWWCPALRMRPIYLSPLIAIHFSQSGWWCPALRMSPIHLSPLTAIHLFPSLAGSARLSACLQFICLSL